MKRVSVSGLDANIWGPTGPSVEKTLEAKSLACFTKMPARPGVSVVVNFTLFADGRRENERATGLCHAAQGDCYKYLETPPAVPANVIECVQAVVRVAALPPVSAGSRSARIEFTPSW